MRSKGPFVAAGLGVVLACCALTAGSPPATPKKPTDCTAIRFTGPGELKVTVQAPDNTFDNKAAPKEHNFAQGAVYRLRLREDAKQVFYPTLEVAAVTPKSCVFLAHAAVPVAFTADDFEQARKGVLVVKVIYLPDPSNQDFSTVVDVEEVVSTKLEAGVDPVAEAKRHGTVLAVIRMGNIDLEKRTHPRSHER